MKDWKYWTLDEYLESLFENKLLQTSEFKTLVRIYGKERVRKSWKNWKSKKKEQAHGKVL